MTAFENLADYDLPGYLSAADWKHHRTRTDTEHDWYRRATGGFAATGVFHLGAQYAPTWEWLDGFTFGFTVDNLFDRHYADSATRSQSGYEVYYPAAGRSYMFTISYAF